MLMLSENSKTLTSFIKAPVPIYMQIYLFNVTNPDAIRFHGAKPILKEVGPYTYREVREKFDLVWGHDDGSVSYQQNFTFFFDEEMSNGLKETDYITTINAVMVVASQVFGNETNPILRTVWSQLEKEMDLFESHVVRELLFEGYPLPEFDFDFSEVLPQLNFTEGWSGTIYEILEAMGVPDIPEFLQDNKMCLMYGRNNSNDGTYKVRTGENGMDNYLNIEEWNGNHTLSYWNSTYCNMINGTDGSQYPPKVTKNTVLRIFTSQLCRSLYLTFEKEISHHGINAYRFTAPEEMLQAADQNPDNACYCYPDQQHCLGSGMLNLQPCAQGANIIMSTPHFYMGDKVELAKLVGLNPNKNDHETFLDVEPRTGVTMKAAKKIQINVPLRPYGNLPSFKNVPEVVFPVLWVNENADVNETLSKEVRKGVSLPFVVVNAICGILIFIGAILLIAGGVKFSRVRNSHGQQKL
ncbi:lysosome membrane protein 2 isoform X3 [Cherax quadricarinatus]|uniref:lysosome membrane protein 2 isoform X3 n=1 Tax=Cherax quadricarinatus TaxID=27406 RepID=UPI00387E3E7D